MSQAVEDKGSWFLKTLGLITVVGILIAVGRIVMKVLNEDEGGEPDRAYPGGAAGRHRWRPRRPAQTPVTPAPAASAQSTFWPACSYS